MSDEDQERNPAMRRLNRKATQGHAYWKSPKLEKKLAKAVGGKRTPGSGNKSVKGDVRKRGIARIEHKATVNKSFSITREMLDKIENAALLNNELPAMVVEFLNDDGTTARKIAVVPYEELLWLIDAKDT